MIDIITDEIMSFRPPVHCRRRKTEPDLIVLHWTGGEGSALSVWSTLMQRRLSVHYVIDRDGQVYQMADPMRTVTYHCGPQNDRSIGVEIVSYGARAARDTVPRVG